MSTRPCRRCETTFKPSRKSQVYCSPRCRLIDYGQVADDNPRRYQLDPDHEYRKLDTWRAHIIELAGGQCNDCDRDEDEVGRPLHVHHVLPRARGGKNTIRNGMLLCPSCHDNRHAQALDEQLVEQIAARVVEELRPLLLTRDSYPPPSKFFELPKGTPPV